MDGRWEEKMPYPATLPMPATSLEEPSVKTSWWPSSKSQGRSVSSSRALSCLRSSCRWALAAAGWGGGGGGMVKGRMLYCSLLERFNTSNEEAHPLNRVESVTLCLGK